MKLFSFLFPNAAYRFVYMLQQVEYDPGKLLSWVATFPDLQNVIHRGKLVLTTKARALLVVSYFVYTATIGLGIYLVTQDKLILGALLMLVANDIVLFFLLSLALVGKVVLQVKRAPMMKSAEDKLINHPGKRIAILGSYGKTSMKEILATVLSEKFKVAMTPGNKNVPISHARWALSDLEGDEDMLIIEYGEGEPGDIKKLAALSHPAIAVLTGVAPNHLDHYKTLDALETDFLSIEDYVSGADLHINSDAKSVIGKLNQKASLYSNSTVSGWKVSDMQADITGTKFVMKKGTIGLKLHSKLIGEHNVGPLALACSMAYGFGMTKDEIERAVGKTEPFEHRMQARQIHGAWLIDDTYNGNLEGFKAGLKLLSSLDAKRKIYVTPGLVDQGEETEEVHMLIGEAIAKSNPDRVVLMQNSNTEFMQKGMKNADYKGELTIESDPLGFYTNIEHYVAAGDVVLMQNDLPDAYA